MQQDEHSDKLLVQKCQNYMRLLNLHVLLIQILQACYEYNNLNPEQDFYVKNSHVWSQIIMTLYEFCKDNLEN